MSNIGKEIREGQSDKPLEVPDQPSFPIKREEKTPERVPVPA